MSRDLNQPRFFDDSVWDGDPLMQRDRTPPGDVIATECASLSRSSPQRAEEIIRIKGRLLDYLREGGVGAEFQGVDFTHWIDSHDERPDPGVLDMRIVGGLLTALRNHDIVQEIDYRSNGGDARAGHHACRRPVYRILTLEFSRLGWIETAREEAA